MESPQEGDWPLRESDLNNSFVEMMLENSKNVIILLGENMDYLDNIYYWYKRIERLEMLFY